MDSELRDLVKENNEILKRMQSHARWGRFFKLVYWGIIIGSLVGTYYYLKPIFNAFGVSVDQVQKSIESIKDLGGNLKLPPELLDAIKKFQQPK